MHGRWLVGSLHLQSPYKGLWFRFPLAAAGLRSIRGFLVFLPRLGHALTTSIFCHGCLLLVRTCRLRSLLHCPLRHLHFRPRLLCLWLRLHESQDHIHRPQRLFCVAPSLLWLRHVPLLQGKRSLLP
ncbi:hypothetical protein VNO77_08569 [Canavalia gladiata]|uniref:Uncharacterized protein n=1 Tax=Canavalia gladiata TaxID=3824 RepID=A0AAN9M9E3_CANGL